MFAAGDVVRVDLDTEVVKLMQDGHGGWNEAMADVSTWTFATPLHIQLYVHVREREMKN